MAFLKWIGAAGAVLGLYNLFAHIENFITLSRSLKFLGDWYRYVFSLPFRWIDVEVPSLALDILSIYFVVSLAALRYAVFSAGPIRSFSDIKAAVKLLIEQIADDMERNANTIIKHLIEWVYIIAITISFGYLIVPVMIKFLGIAYASLVIIFMIVLVYFGSRVEKRSSNRLNLLERSARTVFLVYSFTLFGGSVHIERQWRFVVGIFVATAALILFSHFFGPTLDAFLLETLSELPQAPTT